MAKSNYDLLQENKNDALAFADEIASQKPKDIGSIEDKLAQAKKSLQNKDFSQTIDLLNEIKDNRIGIVWSDRENSTGTTTRVRDGRNVDTDKAKDIQHEAYAMQVVNEVRASIKLIDNEGRTRQKEEAKEKLLYLAEKALNDVDSLGPDTVKEYNTLIVDSLKKGGVEDPSEKLVFAMQLTNFDDKHRHITTLSTTKDDHGLPHTVVEADIMLNGTTKELKRQYQAIIKDDLTELRKPDLQWYSQLPRYQQKLIKEIAPKMVEGNHVLPTQMLSTMPGIRNGYNKVTAIKSEGQEMDVLVESIHSGTPASYSKVVDDKGKEKIAQMNVDMLKTFSKNGCITLHSLNNRVAGLKNVMEDKILRQIEAIAKKDSMVSKAVSPMNDFRKIRGSSRDNKQFKQDLKLFAEGLDKKNYKEIKSYLTTGKNKKTALKQIEKFRQDIQNSRDEKDMAKFKSVIVSAVETRKAIDTPVRREKSNVNLEVSSRIGYIITYMQQEDNLLTHKEEAAAHAVSCKSGKDRTGEKEREGSKKAIDAILGIGTNEMLNKKNLLRQVSAGHAQEMAGIQGGTIGCFGIKKNSVGIQRERQEKIVKGIRDRKSSYFNSKIAEVPKKDVGNIIKAFEQEFAQKKHFEKPLPEPPKQEPKAREDYIRPNKPLPEPPRPNNPLPEPPKSKVESKDMQPPNYPAPEPPKPNLGDKPLPKAPGQKPDYSKKPLPEPPKQEPKSREDYIRPNKPLPEPPKQEPKSREDYIRPNKPLPEPPKQEPKSREDYIKPNKPLPKIPPDLAKQARGLGDIIKKIDGDRVKANPRVQIGKHRDSGKSR